MLIHFTRRSSYRYEFSSNRFDLVDRLPCLKAFIDDFTRPAAEVGPRESLLFRRFASI
jgi:hypothetical protein